MSSFTYSDPGVATATAAAPSREPSLEFSPEELLTLSQLHVAPIHRYWRAYLPAFAVLLCMIYVVPTAIELLLIRYVNPYACALLGDVVGCCFDHCRSLEVGIQHQRRSLAQGGRHAAMIA